VRAAPGLCGDPVRDAETDARTDGVIAADLLTVKGVSVVPGAAGAPRGLRRLADNVPGMRGVADNTQPMPAAPYASV
jgi:hypothetical protein